MSDSTNMLSNKSINRRVCIRRSADITVYFSSASTRPENRLKRFSVRDLSNMGAFIEMRPVNIHRDMRVHLIFALKLGSLVKLHRISAVVVHIARGGIGVRFLLTKDLKYKELS